MSRRVKISFDTVNGDNYTVVNVADMHAANERIRAGMDAKARDYKRKENASIIDARNLVLTR